jgi:hypothetical protein
MLSGYSRRDSEMLSDNGTTKSTTNLKNLKMVFEKSNAKRQERSDVIKLEEEANEVAKEQLRLRWDNDQVGKDNLKRYYEQETAVKASLRYQENQEKLRLNQTCGGVSDQLK